MAKTRFNCSLAPLQIVTNNVRLEFILTPVHMLYRMVEITTRREDFNYQ